MSSGSYRYDHLSSCLKKLLLEKPKNSVDYFEEISRQIKKEKLTSKTDSLVVSYEFLSYTRVVREFPRMTRLPTVRL